MDAACTAFHRDGLVVVRAALPPAMLAEVRAAAQATRERAERELPSGVRILGRHRAAAAADAAGAGAWTWGINELTRHGWHDPRLVAVLAVPALRAMIEGLLAQPRAWGMKLLWAPRAIDYRLHWHRDIGWEHEADLAAKPAAQDHVQINLALEPDDAFVAVPGSHRRAATAAERAAIAADPFSPLPGAERIRLAPGDALIMDAHALHRGDAAAGAPRLTLHHSLQAQWVPLTPWGDPDDFAWISSPEFADTLPATLRPCYARLATAERAAVATDWLRRRPVGRPAG